MVLRLRDQPHTDFRDQQRGSVSGIGKERSSARYLPVLQAALLDAPSVQHYVDCRCPCRKG